MADPTLVNGQVTDSVTQTNLNVVAESPAQAMGALYQVSSHSMGMAMQNAVATQQAMNQVTSSIASVGAKMILDLANK